MIADMHPLLLIVTKEELNKLHRQAAQGDRKACVRLDHLLNLFISLRDEAIYNEQREVLYESAMSTV